MTLVVLPSQRASQLSDGRTDGRIKFSLFACRLMSVCAMRRCSADDK